MPSMKCMMVPTDFSGPSDHALEYAIGLAPRLGMQIHVLHVIDDASFAATYPSGVRVELPGIRERLVTYASDQLKTRVARSVDAGVYATSETAIGSPADVIARTAACEGTDLIVMGTHGRGGLSHLVLGSVAERVIRTAPCGVLTVRDSSRVPDALAAGGVATDEAPRLIDHDDAIDQGVEDGAPRRVARDQLSGEPDAR